MSNGDSMNKRAKWYAILLLILAMFYALRYRNFDGVTIPTPARIEAKNQRARQLQKELENLQKMREKNLTKRADIHSLVADFWVARETVPTTQIQLEIERLGRRTGVTLNKVGAPRLSEISKNIRAVDVTVSTTTTVKSLSGFLKELDGYRPSLTWRDCIIRPNRTKDPTAVMVSGNVRAYIIDEGITRYLQGESL